MTTAPVSPRSGRSSSHQILAAAAIRAPLVIGPGVDWETILSLAHGRAFMPGLAAQLLGGSPRRALPRLVREELGLAREQAATAAQLLVADVEWTAGVLERAGVSCVVLKGAAMHLLFGADLVRHTDDIDILVETTQRDQAIRALLAAGCRDAAPNGPDTRLTELSIRHFPAVNLQTPRGTWIDLHWEARAGAVQRAFRDRTQILNRRGVAVRVPSAEMLAHTLSDHVLVHHGAHARYLLRHLADMAFLVERSGLDRAAWRRLALRSPAVALSLGLLAATVPGHPLEPLAHLFLFPPKALASIRDSGEYAVKLLIRAGMLARKPTLLWERLVPPAEYMREHFGADGEGLFRAHVARLGSLPVHILRPVVQPRLTRPDRT